MSSSENHKRKNRTRKKEATTKLEPLARLEEDLRSLLMDGTASNQEQLRVALIEKGHCVNQSKISRLLRKIGAIKARNEHGEIVYRLPREPAPPLASAELSSLVLEISANETTIVVNTSPGSAQLIARILDHHRQNLKILGSIAGDDTILLIPTSIKTLSESVNHLNTLLLPPRRH